MNKKDLIPFLFILSFILVLIGAFSKILHQPLGMELIIAGFLCTLIYTVLSLREIFSSNKFEKTEKILWLLAFLAFNTFAGMFYLSGAKKKIY